MRINEKILWFGLRCCLYCGSLNREPDGLCSVCSADLWSWQKQGGGRFHQTIHKLEVVALFRWIPGKQEVLSRLVRVLKGDGGKKLWQVYASEFVRQGVLETAPKRKKILIIPAPSRDGKTDHALLFARALAAEMPQAELYSCLSRKGQGSQKKKSRSQRQKTVFEWAENFTPREFNQKSVGKTVLFVDDIVTTGSTARAAWKVLGKPRDFAVWALAQRALSCGASTDLI